MAPGLVTQSPSPQTVHPPAGTTGQGVGPTGAGVTGAGVAITGAGDGAIGAEVGMTGAAVVGGAGRAEAHPQRVSTSPGRNGHWSVGTIPEEPAASRTPHETSGWLGNAKIAVGLVTQSPSPQTEHPPSLMAGQSVGSNCSPEMATSSKGVGSNDGNSEAAE